MLDSRHRWYANYKPIFWGFLCSLILTLIAYYLVSNRWLEGSTLKSFIICIISLQVILQLVLFLNLGLESKPHWNLVTFLFMVLVFLVVIGGTLWIMSNLNYNVKMNFTYPD